MKLQVALYRLRKSVVIDSNDNTCLVKKKKKNFKVHMLLNRLIVNIKRILAFLLVLMKSSYRFCYLYFLVNPSINIIRYAELRTRRFPSYSKKLAVRMKFVSRGPRNDYLSFQSSIFALRRIPQKYLNSNSN